MPVDFIGLFACPRCKISFADSKSFKCSNCDIKYPVVNFIPILINDENSVFKITDYNSVESSYGGASSYAGNLDNRNGIRQVYRKLMFRISENRPPKIEFDVAAAVREILFRKPNAKILVIGAGDTSIDGRVIYTDVAFGKMVDCIADAHDLPFPDGSFDACIACAVLEHVVDPYRCVQEITRILKLDGFVYAETPFMQPVHMGAHDFTRFTFLGHRRLFRNFSEIKSGIAGGPGVSAAQLLRYAISSLSDRPRLKKWLKLLSILGTYPLRWIDYISHKNISAYDSASGFYFFGQRTENTMSDEVLLKSFRGS